MPDPMSSPQAMHDKARRQLFIVIAIVVVAVLSAATVGLLMANRGSSKNTRSSAAHEPTQSKGDDGVVDLPDLTNLITPEQLQALQWETICGAWRPISERDGPKSTEEGRAERFAHTPTGALIAANHLANCGSSTAGSQVFEPTIDEQFIGGSKTQLLDTTRRDYDKEHRQAGVPEGEPIPESVAETVGFAFRAYSTQAATVEIVLQMSERDKAATGYTYAMFTLQLRWKDNDWKAIAPENGAWANSFTPLRSTDGYTLYPGH